MRHLRTSNPVNPSRWVLKNRRQFLASSTASGSADSGLGNQISTTALAGSYAIITGGATNTSQFQSMEHEDAGMMEQFTVR